MTINRHTHRSKSRLDGKLGWARSPPLAASMPLDASLHASSLLVVAFHHSQAHPAAKIKETTEHTPNDKPLHLLQSLLIGHRYPKAQRATHQLKRLFAKRDIFNHEF